MMFPLLILLLFGIPLLLLILAIVFFVQKDTKKGKLFLILLGVYLLISLGVCGIMLASF